VPEADVKRYAVLYLATLIVIVPLCGLGNFCHRGGVDAGVADRQRDRAEDLASFRVALAREQE
jgi:hypothetical protein